MEFLKRRLRYITAKIQLIRRHYWVAFIILFLGLVSSSILFWAYLNNLHQNRYDIASLEIFNKLQAEVASTHLLLDEFLSRNVNVDSTEIFKQLKELTNISDKMYTLLTLDQESENSKTHEKLRAQIKLLQITLLEFGQVSHERIKWRYLGKLDLSLAQKFDELFVSITNQINTTENYLSQEFMNRNYSLVKALWIIISFWLLIVFIAFTSIRRKEYHRYQLLQTLEQNKQILQATMDGYILADTNGKIIDVNPAYCKMIGYIHDELVNMNIWDLEIIYDRQEVENKIKEFIKKGQAQFESKHKHKDGHILDVEVSLVIMYKKEKLLIAAFIRDVTNRKKVEKLIRQNNIFLHTVIDSLSYPFYVINVDDYSIKMSNKAAQCFKTKDKTRCYECFHNRKTPCDLTEHPCTVEEVKKRKERVVLEQIHYRKDGEPRFIEVHGYPIFDDNGKVTQVIEYGIDITERKKTEQKLIEMAAFPESNANIVMSVDAKAKVLYMNKATKKKLKALGFKEDQADKILPENIKEIITHCVTTGKGKEDVEFSVKERIINWSFQPVENRNIVHCYAFDKTRSVKQAQELKKLSMAVNQSSNFVCITDTEGSVEYVNPSFTKVTGYSMVEVIGKPISILKSGKHDKRFYQQLWRTISDGKTWTGIIHNRKKDSELFWAKETITPIFNKKHEIINYLSIGNDITDELLMQQKLVESDKLSAIGTLAAGVAHEFKNYLGGIIGNASFAVDELDDEKGLEVARETLTEIIEMGERANDVAMSLLSYSRSNPEDKKMESIQDIINKSIHLLEKEIKSNDIEIITHFDKVPSVEVSASKIQQLLLNLLINAHHAIKSNGVITLALLNKGNRLELKVADTGSGISEDIIDKIFDPFFSTKGVWGQDEVVGTGMGLSICRNIAREHDGDLTVESTLDIGTTFTLTLPLQDEDKQHLKTELHQRPEIKGLIFSLDKSILTQYYQKACEFNTRLMIVNDIIRVPKKLDAIAEFVICDSKFPGKVELLKLVERCKMFNIPLVMINCGMMEYQLEEVYHFSLANFKALPDFEKIISLVSINNLKFAKV
ncbi:MAG: PAS domain S-box protein [FCB group bacterium]|nr:PAS domain S-box protein [FCB group bacterium]